MIFDLHDFCQAPIGRCPGDAEPVLYEEIFVVVIEFITVSVSLAYLLFAVSIEGKRHIFDKTWIGPQSHGGPFFCDVSLFGEKINHRI